MTFQLKPSVRQLSIAFPLLLIALPAVLRAADDSPGVALPPPSLYDTPAPAPRQPSAIAPKPSVTAPAAAPAPAATAPAAQTKADVQPKADTQAAQAKPAAQPAPAAAAVGEEAPWYKRWFGFLTPSSQPAQDKPQMTADAGNRMGSLNNGERNQFAYDTPSKAIRTSYGQCVRTGFYNGAGSADCESNLQHQQAAKPQPDMVAQAPGSQRAAGSAPAREIARSEPVEVTPLPPRPQPVNEVKVAPANAQRDEIITALAAERPIAKPDYEKLTLSAGALFAVASADIKPLGREKLDDFAAKLKDMDYDKIKIVGHTDPTGSAAKNKKLSKRRAESVKKYLVSKGIDASRIVTEGRGASEPLPKTRDCDALGREEKSICYAPDRRVDIQLVGGKPRS
jgi:outer membrane protein OmpA-like peptidoglycan-associated protein